jgi:small-conductance mechanosensitive channel
VIFGIITFLLINVVGVPTSPHFDASSSGDEFWERVLECCWWILAARGALGLMQFAVVRDNRPHQTQIIFDLIRGALYILTLLAIVNFVFDIPVIGLVATSGIIAIVLGLALQSTLSDVFSGIAIGLERPYKTGDLIWVEGDIEGRVERATWRSTHIATGRGNIAIVPNNVIAKSRLENRSRPTEVRSDFVVVRLDPNARSQTCMSTLTAAVQSCSLLLPVPPPKISCTGLSGDGCTYRITFSVASSAELDLAKSLLNQEVQDHLSYSGVALAVPGSSDLSLASVPLPQQILERSDLFGSLQPSQRQSLSDHLTMLVLHAGDTIVSQGEPPSALFVIASGAADVRIADAKATHSIHRTRLGETIGAGSLITGSNYGATVFALTQMKVYRLDKAAVAAALASDPTLEEGLETLARLGLAALQANTVVDADSMNSKPDGFLENIRGFIRVLKSK